MPGSYCRSFQRNAYAAGVLDDLNALRNLL